MKKIVLTGVLSLLFVTSLTPAQGTPDGETPANEGICDLLVAGTPGLYGLCVAYCEALDCESPAESNSVQPIPCNSPANQKILENYRKKMMPGDPDMPCVHQPCPCWTEQELESIQLILHDQIPFPIPVFVAEDQCVNALNGPFCTRLNSPSLAVLEYFGLPPDPCLFTWHGTATDFAEAGVFERSPTDLSCDFLDITGEVPILRFQKITPEQRDLCLDQIRLHGEMGGWSCFDGQ